MMTGVGMILGTAAYMSPEQAKGRSADKRSDVWAFGCVLHEMLTGKSAFKGADVSDTLAAILRGEPDWTTLPAGTPPSIRRVLRRALKKDARHRLSDIRDARIEIDEAGADAEESVPPALARGTQLGWIAFAAAMFIAVLLAIPAVRYLRETTPPEMRVEINTPSTLVPLHFALSPDSRFVVFVASGNGPQRLWLRALDRTDAQPLEGTEGAELPFWSADSRSIGFFASGRLNRIDLGGGPAQALANAPQGRGGTWNADGVILFGPTSLSPIFRVAASGGDASAVTQLDSLRGSHRYPQFLPDGRHFLFYLQGIPEKSGIYLASLDGGEPKRLTTADTAGVYLRPDRVVFVRQGALVARRLDVARGELSGEPMTLADPVVYDPTFNLGGFSISGDGRVAYRSAAAGRQQLMWYDREGKAGDKAGEPDANGLFYPELSPDGRQVAVERTVENNADIWLMNLVRGGLTRFTADAAIDNCAVWSPDEARIAFNSNRTGQYNLYVKPTNGAGVEELLLQTPNYKAPQDWSRDGRFLLYMEIDPKTGRDLWAVDLTEKHVKPQVVVNTQFDESLAQFSPDGRWVAYQTNESGRFETVVQAFPDSRGKSHVSTNGGIEPRWSADGKELYFIAPDGTLMDASVSASNSRFETTTPKRLFPTRVAGGAANLYRPQYAVSRDGRFLINQLAEESASAPITLILNWNAGQRK